MKVDVNMFLTLNHEFKWRLIHLFFSLLIIHVERNPVTSTIYSATISFLAVIIPCIYLWSVYLLWFVLFFLTTGKQQLYIVRKHLGHKHFHNWHNMTWHHSTVRPFVNNCWRVICELTYEGLYMCAGVPTLRAA